MPVSLTRSEGVTVLTMTSDPSSSCPPICQLLGAMCYTPKLCSRSWRLAVRRGGSQAVLGALWIMTGVMHLGLGLVILTNWRAASYQLRDTYCPVWLGVIFMGVGVSSILTEKYARPCVMVLNGILNLFGAAMSITAIVWYSTLFTHDGFYYMCDSEHDYYYEHSYRTTTTPTPQQNRMKEECLEAKQLVQILVISISAVLVALAVLGLCLGISSATLSFKALKTPKDQDKQDREPLLEEDGAAAEKEGLEV